MLIYLVYDHLLLVSPQPVRPLRQRRDGLCTVAFIHVHAFTSVLLNFAQQNETKSGQLSAGSNEERYAQLRMITGCGYTSGDGDDDDDEDGGDNGDDGGCVGAWCYCCLVVGCLLWLWLWWLWLWLWLLLLLSLLIIVVVVVVVVVVAAVVVVVVVGVAVAAAVGAIVGAAGGGGAAAAAGAEGHPPWD